MGGTIEGRDERGRAESGGGDAEKWKGVMVRGEEWSGVEHIRREEGGRGGVGWMTFWL